MRSENHHSKRLEEEDSRSRSLVMTPVVKSESFSSGTKLLKQTLVRVKSLYSNSITKVDKLKLSSWQAKVEHHYQRHQTTRCSPHDRMMSAYLLRNSLVLSISSFAQVREAERSYSKSYLFNGDKMENHQRDRKREREGERGKTTRRRAREHYWHRPIKQ